MKTVSRHPKHKPINYQHTEETLHPYYIDSFSLHYSDPSTLCHFEPFASLEGKNLINT